MITTTEDPDLIAAIDWLLRERQFAADEHYDPSDAVAKILGDLDMSLIEAIDTAAQFIVCSRRTCGIDHPGHADLLSRYGTDN